MSRRFGAALVDDVGRCSGDVLFRSGATSCLVGEVCRCCCVPSGVAAIVWKCLDASNLANAVSCRLSTSSCWGASCRRLLRVVDATGDSCGTTLCSGTGGGGLCVGFVGLLFGAMTGTGVAATAGLGTFGDAF